MIKDLFAKYYYKHFKNNISLYLFEQQQKKMKVNIDPI